MRPRRASETSQCSASVSSGLASAATRGIQQFAFDVEQRDTPAVGQKALRHRKSDAACGGR